MHEICWEILCISTFLVGRGYIQQIKEEIFLNEVIIMRSVRISCGDTIFNVHWYNGVSECWSTLWMDLTWLYIYIIYYLEISCHNYEKTYLLLAEKPFGHKEKIWLYHPRFVHISFSTLKILFPALFTTLIFDNFQCEICEFAKHKTISFHISNSRTTKSFHLMIVMYI